MVVSNFVITIELFVWFIILSVYVLIDILCVETHASRKGGLRGGGGALTWSSGYNFPLFFFCFVFFFVVVCLIYPNDMPDWRKGEREIMLKLTWPPCAQSHAGGEPGQAHQTAGQSWCGDGHWPVPRHCCPQKRRQGEGLIDWCRFMSWALTEISQKHMYYDVVILIFIMTLFHTAQPCI